MESLVDRAQIIWGHLFSVFLVS